VKKKHGNAVLIFVIPHLRAIDNLSEQLPPALAFHRRTTLS